MNYRIAQCLFKRDGWPKFKWPMVTIYSRDPIIWNYRCEIIEQAVFVYAWNSRIAFARKGGAA